MKLFGILIPFICLLCSCDDHYDKIYSVKMRDGNTIKVLNSQRVYSTEKDFLHNISFAFPRSYDLRNVEQCDYTSDSIFVIEDYNQSFTGAWEVAVFGEWIRAYGLIPHTPYYVATTVFAKYVSAPPRHKTLYPLGGTYMGYIPGLERPSFFISHSPDYTCNIFTTGARLIGYDSSKNAISIYIPSFINTNKLTWYFQVDTSPWF